MYMVARSDYPIRKSIIEKAPQPLRCKGCGASFAGPAVQFILQRDEPECALFRKAFGLFRLVNKPEAGGGSSNGRQEGCSYGNGSQDFVFQHDNSSLQNFLF
jgi:hypothetical protein